jgi:hypothetical protein
MIIFSLKKVDFAKCVCRTQTPQPQATCSFCTQGCAFIDTRRLILLSYDPNSVSQEKGRLLTERSGGPSPVGLGRIINTR